MERSRCEKTPVGICILDAQMQLFRLQQCFFLEGNLAVNPFTNVNRLEVFRNLSCGEGSQLISSRESLTCPSSVLRDCDSTGGSSPA